MGNYAWTTGKELPDGTVFENDNFHQREPHTAIFSGKSGLTFRNCNLINCDIPADSVVEGGVRCHVSHCSNVHPEWTDKGLTVCDVNCSHVTDTDTVTIDGVAVDTIYHYEDKAVA
jgi:hypothetical protein